MWRSAKSLSRISMSTATAALAIALGAVLLSSCTLMTLYQYRKGVAVVNTGESALPFAQQSIQAQGGPGHPAFGVWVKYSSITCDAPRGSECDWSADMVADSGWVVCKPYFEVVKAQGERTAVRYSPIAPVSTTDKTSPARGFHIEVWAEGVDGAFGTHANMTVKNVGATGYGPGWDIDFLKTQGCVFVQN